MAKKGLGRGLNALFGMDSVSDKPSLSVSSEPDGKSLSAEQGGESADNINEISISMIEPNMKQARKNFDGDKLDALADSIREHGIIQPILAVKSEHGMYKIVAGERRWRAAKKVGLKTVPVIVRTIEDIDAAQISLIENLQREDLNPIEEAFGYKSLMDEYSFTQEEISKRIGKSRSAVANSLRLLSLGNEIKSMLEEGTLSAGHARALLGIENPELRLEAANIVIDEDLNVRQTEKLVKKLLTPKHAPAPKNDADEEFGIQLDAIAERLCSKFGTKVKISHSGKKGKIEIEYYDGEDLDRILNILSDK